MTAVKERFGLYRRRRKDSVYTDRSHSEKNPRYVYDRLYVSLVSASPAFLNWARQRHTICWHAAREAGRESVAV